MTTHPLLEELHTLGVKLTTDGITLKIDAPKGVMTPALREKLAAQKQDLIPVLCAAGCPEDTDERLYSFAQTISHMVDVLGGSDNVRITKHERGLTLERYARTIRPPYQPVTLRSAQGPLPSTPHPRLLQRPVCPHHVMGIRWKKDGAHQVVEKCRGQPLPHGWCDKHGLSNSLLTLGALLGYPGIALGRREIGEGVAQWEAYAECFELDHLARDIARICTIFRVTKENGEWK